MADINNLLATARQEMSQVIDSFTIELQKVRVGAVNIELIKSISVEVYGSFIPMYQVATISIPSANSIVITPWDKNNLRNMALAVEVEFKGEINPNVKDDAVYLNFPPLTLERKEEFVRFIKDKGEQYRQRLREVRQTIKSMIDEIKKKSEAPEDEVFKALAELDEITKEYTEKINDMYEAKKNQLLK